MEEVWGEIQRRAVGGREETVYAWLDPQYWTVAKEALEKDQIAIIRAAELAGVNPRLVVGSLMVEQLRLFFSQRELFKQFFQPLKIFANSTQISLGVMAIKPETAAIIERNLKDTNSLYYLGEERAGLLDYPAGVSIEDERVKRLSSEADNHFWSYLYGALYIKELMMGWERAGFSINERPEIIGTLYNVGFSQSKPKTDPKVGGSTVVVNGRDYSFGHLVSEFYFSGELMEIYPEL
jgi:hypothetical protein